MTRVRRTQDYLADLRDGDYPRCEELVGLYDEWKRELDIQTFSRFLDTIWEEKDNIRPKYLGTNTYSNFRGIAFEELCFDLLCRAIQRTGIGATVEPFWNQRVVMEEFYLFDGEQFKVQRKYKAVDVVAGKSDESESGLVHPLVIISCKTWQSTNWLDEDKAVYDSVRSRYPNVIGYSLCMSLSVPAVSLISCQRTGLRVFDLSKEYKGFVEDIERTMQDLREMAGTQNSLI